ncbi:MAG: LysM peptidoglycan-binding domain-containing protein, partial [Stellaceae bacterium]
MGFVLTGFLAACSTGPQTPAPVYSGGEAGSGWSAPPREAYGSPPRETYGAPPRRSYEEQAERSYAPRPLGGTPAARPLPPLSPPGPAASLGPPRSPPGPVASLGPAPGPGTRITVTRGQSLGFLAQRYHVSERTLIDANHLRSPYKIEIGQQLLIPGAAGPMAAEAGPGSPPPRGPRVAEREPAVIPLDG